MTMNKICLPNIDIEVKKFNVEKLEVFNNINIKKFDDITIKPFEIIDQD